MGNGRTVSRELGRHDTTPAVVNWPITAVILTVAVWMLYCGCDDGDMSMPTAPAVTIVKTVTNTDGTKTDYLSDGTYQAHIFQPQDALICVNWPRCPDGIIRWYNKPARTATACQATFAGWFSECGACVDTRTPSCAPYVGRCMAPDWPMVPADYCGEDLSPPQAVVNSWTLCTGADAGPGNDARVVCGEPS